MTPTVPAEMRRRRRADRWIGASLWVALLGLIAAIGGLAIAGCGLGRPAWLSFCPAPVSAEAGPDSLVAERDRERVLSERLDTLRLALVSAPDCPVLEPPVEVAEAPPPEPPPEPIEIEEAPEPPVAAPTPDHRPTPPPRPQPPPEPEPPPAPPADIPEEAWEERDTSFLEGCWSLISDYRLDIRGIGIIRVRSLVMCFDPAGNGSQTLVFSDGTTCRGSARANFLPTGQLGVDDLRDLRCDNGGTVYRRAMNCNRVPDGTARCISTRVRDGGGPHNVVFQR